MIMRIAGSPPKPFRRLLAERLHDHTHRGLTAEALQALALVQVRGVDHDGLDRDTWQKLRFVRRRLRVGEVDDHAVRLLDIRETLDGGDDLPSVAAVLETLHVAEHVA